jgi:transposase
MSTSKNKKYSAEFIESSVRLAKEGDKSIAQTARDLGINPNTLYGWIDKYPKLAVGTMSSSSGEHIYEENKKLKKELARVKIERDILKKAAAYFAGECQ